jgi:hypothetical protein
MGSQGLVNQSDVFLLPFLEASNEAESEEQLGKLIAEQTETPIKNVIRSRLRVSLSPSDDRRANQDALEILSDVQTLLIAHLRNLKTQNGAGGVINNFKAYAASVAFNACHQYLRQKYPLRTQLKYKLRYLLAHQQNLALWQTDTGETIAGFEKWQFQAKQFVVLQAREIESLKTALADFGNRNLQSSERAFYVELLSEIFNHTKTPVEFDNLVSFIVEFQGIEEFSEIAETVKHEENRFEKIANAKQNLAGEIEQKERLRRLWNEICELPVRHRAALLLNLKDKGGESVITFLPLLRIATIRQIAEALDFKPEEFAAVWNGLPWDDLKIAEHLGVTRQQVINLRQSARMRLGRLINE